MSGYNNRKRSMDSKLTQDSELRFRVANRRNRLLGHWAAEQLGLTGQAGDEYAQAVVRADLEQSGDAGVVRKVLADFVEADLSITEAQLRSKMSALQPQAQQQIHGEA